MTTRQRTTLIWILAGGLLGCLVVGRAAHRVLLPSSDGFEGALITTASGIIFGLMATWLNWPPFELSEGFSAMRERIRSRTNTVGSRKSVP